MSLLHTSAVVAIALVGGCVSQAQTTPEYGDNYAGLSTGPGDETYDESSWVGPPGGSMDPGYGYADPSLAQSPSEQSADPTAAGVYGGTMYGGQTYGQAWADPTAPTDDPGVWAGATAEVTDGEIDMTLDAYGEWIEDADYGRVWRPYTTVVGAEFTPYESCGDWVYTEYGWTFQSCDAWNWGWLAFHFGRWAFIDDSWCWSRDYTWGPGWVDWRGGGGYVGWRPMRPTRQIRDHRDRTTGPLIRDHRRGAKEEWHFTQTDNFGHRPLRHSPSVDVREGLRATTSVAQPPTRGDHRGRASTVMAGRLRDHQRFEARTRGTIGQSTRGYQQSPLGPQRGYNVGTRTNPTRGAYNPTYNPVVVSPNPSRPTWNRNRYNPPTATNTGGYRYNPTRPQPTYNGGYNPPTQGTRTYSGGNRYNPQPYGSGNRYNPQTYSSGGNRSNPPTRPSSSWGGTRGTAPSPSSRPSTNWGGSRSSSPSPSRGSYSAPSHSSSSYSGGSRSSSSSSSSSSSGGSRSSSSSSSGGSHGGGRHR